MGHEQHNILLIMCDQMNPMLTSAYGDPVAMMPNLDRLAREGVVFENAYCNSPLCAPSRSSMMTGRLVSDLEGALDNGSVLSSEVPTFADMLNRSGYRTVLTGKMHFVGADQLHGYSQRLTTDIYPADLGWSPAKFDAPEPTHGSYGPMIYSRCGVAENNVQLEYDESVHARAIPMLRTLADGEAPFMLTVSYTHPHSPFQAPARFFDLYKDAELSLPVVSDDFPQFLDEYNQFLCRDFGYRGRLDDSLMRTILQSYYGMYSYLDEKIGELMAVLQKSSAARNTVVVLTSDHGEMMGSKGMFEKRTFFEASSRVPLMLWSPTQFAPRRVDRAVSLLDLFPTFVDIAGSDWPLDRLRGQSLVPEARGDDPRDPTTVVISEYYGESIKYPYRMGVLDRLKYVHFPECPEKDLLFDLQADPDEFLDRSGDSAYAWKRAILRSEVLSSFDYPRLQSVIARSQSDRQLILSTYPAHAPDWDFEPGDGSSRKYVRTRVEG